MHNSGEGRRILRETRKIGNSDFIKLEPIDKKDLDINIGTDMVDISDIVVVKQNRGKKK